MNVKQKKRRYAKYASCGYFFVHAVRKKLTNACEFNGQEQRVHNNPVFFTPVVRKTHKCK